MTGRPLPVAHPLHRVFKTDGKPIPSSLTVFDETDSSDTWESLFQCRTEWHRFPMDHWLNSIDWDVLTSDWITSYNKGEPASIADLLRRVTPCDKSDRLMYFNSPFEVIETTWADFTEHWMQFFEYCDESFAWVPRRDLLMLVTPVGAICSASVRADVPS
jgi:hypothetical protein